MRDEKRPSGADFLVGLVVVGALATGKAWDYVKGTLAHVIEAAGYLLFIALKVGAVAVAVYSLYKLVLWVIAFLERIDGLEKRITEIDEKLSDISSDRHRLFRIFYGVSKSLGELEKRLTAFEEGTKRGKDNATSAIGAVVSEITKG